MAAVIVTFVNAVANWNTLEPIDVTLGGMLIDVKLDVLLNAELPIDVTVAGIIIDVIPVPLNALESIDVILGGLAKVTDVNFEILVNVLNAYIPIEVIQRGCLSISN